MRLVRATEPLSTIADSSAREIGSPLWDPLTRARVIWCVVAGGYASAVLLAVLTGYPVLSVALLMVILLAVSQCLVLKWQNLLAGYMVVLLLVPPNAYRIPAPLPFDLQADRLAALALFGCWAAALLVDRRACVARTSFDAPLAVLVLVVTLALAVNYLEPLYPGHQADLVKSLLYLVSLVGLYYLTASTIRPDAVDRILSTLVTIVWGLAVLGIVEHFTGYNVFRSLHSWFPFLEFRPYNIQNRGGVRIAGSAEHPIAFGALLAMVVPVVVWRLTQAQSVVGKTMFAMALATITFALVFTASRSAVIGLGIAVLILVFFNLDKKRALLHVGALFFAIFFLVHMLAPGALGTIRAYFMPQEGLLASQGLGERTEGIGKRIERYPFIWKQFSQRPLLGIGFETFNPRFFFFVDSEYLKLLLEIGAVGLLTVLWLLGRVLRRFAREVRKLPDGDRNRLASILASCSVYVVVSLFYDTVGFAQTTYLFFVLMALGVLASHGALGRVAGQRADRIRYGT